MTHQPTIEGESNRRESPVTHLLAAPNVAHYASATGSFKLTWLLLALPADRRRRAAARRQAHQQVGPLLRLCAMAVISFVIGLIAVLRAEGHAREMRAPSTSTCSAGSRSTASSVDVGLLIDPLSSVFVLLITGVGSLIHIYSIGYMAHDPAGDASSPT